MGKLTKSITFGLSSVLAIAWYASPRDATFPTQESAWAQESKQSQAIDPTPESVEVVERGFSLGLGGLKLPAILVLNLKTTHGPYITFEPNGIVHAKSFSSGEKTRSTNVAPPATTLELASSKRTVPGPVGQQNSRNDQERARALRVVSHFGV